MTAGLQLFSQKWWEHSSNLILLVAMARRRALMTYLPPEPRVERSEVGWRFRRTANDSKRNLDG